MRRLLIVTIVSSLALLGVPATAGAQPAVEASPRAESSSSLRWTACEGDGLKGAQCAFLRVPRDWARPSAGNYRIAVARIRAEVAPTRGVLMFNPGGPGGAGLDALRFVQRGLPKEVRDSFDVVTFDPRGVGESQPTFAPCRTPQPDLPATGPVDWEAATSAYVDAMSAALQECFEANSADAEFVGTWQVIRDMDSLRRALGVKKISFWGMSYGTTLGRAYAQQFPQRLRALVLDGTITPTPSVGDYAREHIWDDATAIQVMLGAFGARSKRAYRTVMSFLEDQTIPTEDGDVLTRWSVSSYLVNKAAYQSQWDEAKQLINALHVVIRTSRAVSRDVARRITSSAVTTRAGGGTNPAYHFVNCSDMHDRPSVRVIAGAAEEAAKVGGTALGATPLGEGTQCAGLPALGRSVPPLAGTLRLPTPPVIVNSIGDNRTPWLGARETANAFTGSSMVTYAGTQHVTYTGTSACVDAAVTPYLLNRTLPPRSVACPLVYP
ncbi:MAG: alpha/beta fold hydrolase [Candidatus Nanopelagicales bacterium]